MISPEIIGLFTDTFGLESDPSEGPWVPSDKVLSVAQALYDRGFTYFSYCAAAHYPATEEEAGYYNVSYRFRRVGPKGEQAAFRIRVLLDAETPSLAGIWIGADWQEREQYDLIGVRFSNHPDLRRIMMPEDWDGHPLQREYAIETPHHPWR